jgi:hypothetical protein
MLNLIPQRARSEGVGYCATWLVHTFPASAASAVS